MRNWREIKAAIEDALDDYNVEVSYASKSRRGDDASCSYFTVEFDEEEDWCWDDIESDIADVCNEYDLQIDDDSDGDFDLCAHWDVND